MGAWGTGHFENDEASDFLYEVEESKNFDLLEAKINEVLESKAEDAHSACEAVAASAILAAVQTGNAAGLPDDAAAWVKTLSQAPPIALLEQAARVLEMILSSDESELRQLWEENEEDFPDWRTSIEVLLGALRQ